MLTASSLTVTGQYEIDTMHTRLGFAARHAMVTTVRGNFSEFSGEIVLDGEQPGLSRAHVVVETASISTGQAQRDNHLRSPDFFDVDTFPEMIYTSTSVEPLGGDDFRITGDLTICAVTHPVVVDMSFGGVVRDQFGSHRAGFAGRGRLRRSDFGLTWNAALEIGGVVVSDEIVLELDIAGVRVR